MIGLVVTVTIKPGHETAFEAIFAGRRQGVLATEPGNRGYDLYRQQGDAPVYVIIERYVDEAAFAAHLAASTNHEAMLACFAGPPAVQRLTPVEGCA